MNKLNKLIDIVKKLRAPNGCDWDKVQTHDSLIPYLLEETYEVIEAIEKNNYNSLKEELGDLLLHIVFQAELLAENSSYSIDDSIDNIVNKLIQYGPYRSIPRLLKHIHFNPKHKENQNIRIPNRKEKYAKIYNGDKWELRDKRETIDDLSDKAYNLLEDHYEGGNKHMNKFIEQFDNDDNTIKKVYKETEMMILNNQNTND